MILSKSRTLISTLRAAAIPTAIILGVGFTLGSCSRDKDVDITTLQYEGDSPQKLYDEALANIQAGNTREALRKFAAIEQQAPLSDQARQAMVMETFLQYRIGKFDAAITAGQKYLKTYPNSKDIPYVEFMVGMSYAKKIANVTQDQSAAESTINAMEELIDQFPDSDYVDQAREQIRFARDQLAGKEMQVGRYYLERKDYVAAISRFNVVVDKYSDTNQIEEALERLVEAYYAMGVISEAQNAAWVLGHNYPDSPWYQRAYKLLNSKGIEPKAKATAAPAAKS
ncbi:outer membrane protein assembly factor BamD [Martelella sp. HB161492]|uniref:outer membrane protein assembly factor BamD n=1 Tax=Martelella sp. HB161492 TaxID=2720726 RepID=UPI0015908B60|nr:outer membrane protein assembly factor BamD [Martelella sp. HB161492]